MAPRVGYSVIEFIGNYDPKLLDLVPETWVMTMKGQLLCKFPDASDYKNLTSMVKNLEPPMKSWKHYSVAVLQNAKQYEQGLRRLQRLQLSATVVSSSAENEENTDPNVVQELTPISTSTEAELFRMPGLQISEVISSSSSDSSDESSPIIQTPSRKRKETRSVSPSPAAAKKYPKVIENKLVSPSSVEHLKLNLNAQISHEDSSFEPINNTPPHKKRFIQATINMNPEKLAVVAKGVGSPSLVKPSTNPDSIVQKDSSLTDNLGPKSCSCAQEIQTAMDKMQKALVKELAKELDGIRSSLAYDMKQCVATFEKSVTERLDHAGIKPLSDPQRTLGIAFPIKTIAEFEAFDQSLAEESREKLLLELMYFWCSPISMSQAVASILSRLLEKEVQLLFSGVGKKTKLGGKRNFSATLCYKCLNLTILGKCKDSSVGEVTRNISKWLARAEDRKGGRKARENKPKASQPVAAATDTAGTDFVASANPAAEQAAAEQPVTVAVPSNAEEAAVIEKPVTEKPDY